MAGHTQMDVHRGTLFLFGFFLVVVCSVRFFQLWKTTVASRDCCFSVVLPIIVYDEAGRAWRKNCLVVAAGCHFGRTWSVAAERENSQIENNKRRDVFRLLLIFTRPRWMAATRISFSFVLRCSSTTTFRFFPNMFCLLIRDPPTDRFRNVSLL